MAHPTPLRTTTRTRARARAVLLLSALGVLAAACVAPPAAPTGPALGPIAKVTAIPGPLFPETSDPSVVRVGEEYFIYGSDNHLRAPITRVTDIDTPLSWWEKLSFVHEGMPVKPAWAAKENQLWAPTVGQFGDRWIMYFAADRVAPPQPHNAQCLGRAFATAPEGPFEPEPTPWHCGLRGVGGALDPELFTDPDGQRWLLAAFGDTESPLHIMRLDARGERASEPVSILDRVHPWEYHFLEQPAMHFDERRGDYLLTYSAGRWFEPGYSTGLARCTTPVGPCTSDPSGPWMASTAERSAPGGLSFFTDTDGGTRAIFATFATGDERMLGGRSANIMRLVTEPTVTLVP
jgi:beta-xylosidase